MLSTRSTLSTLAELWGRCPNSAVLSTSGRVLLSISYKNKNNNELETVSSHLTIPTVTRSWINKQIASRDGFRRPCVTFLQQLGVSFLHQADDDVMDAGQVSVAILTLHRCFQSSGEVFTAHTNTPKQTKKGKIVRLSLGTGRLKDFFSARASEAIKPLTLYCCPLTQ